MAEGWERVESRQEEAIHRATRRGHLMPAKDLIDELNMVRQLDVSTIVATVRGQYELARRRELRGWIRDLHHFGVFLMSGRELQWYFPQLEESRRDQSQRQERQPDVSRRDNRSGRERERARPPRDQRRASGQGRGDHVSSQRPGYNSHSGERMDVSSSRGSTAGTGRGTTVSFEPRAVGVASTGRSERRRSVSPPQERRYRSPERRQRASGMERQTHVSSSRNRVRHVSVQTEAAYSPGQVVRGPGRSVATQTEATDWSRRRPPAPPQKGPPPPKRHRRDSGGKRDQHVVKGDRGAAQALGRRKTREGPKRTKCPYQGCEAAARRVKRHVMSQHLPEVFHDRESAALLQNPRFQERRLRGLEILAREILGRPTVRGLLAVVGRLPCDPSNDLTASSTRAMYKLCRHAKWGLPRRFSLAPVSSPAVLIHWRPLAYLVGKVSENARRRLFRECGRAALDNIRGRAGTKLRREGSGKVQDTRAGQRLSRKTTDGDGKVQGVQSGQSFPPTATGRVEVPCQVQVAMATAPEGDRTEEAMEVFTEEPAAPTPADRVEAVGAKPKVLLEGREVQLTTMSQVSTMSGALELTLAKIPGATAPKDRDTPNSSRSKSPTAQEEEALLKSDSESSPSQSKPLYAAVVKGLASIGVVRPTRSPTDKRRQLRDVSLPAAFDSHFHADRLAAAVGRSALEIDRLATQVTEVEPKNKTTLSGGVLVYCDPKTYDKVLLNAPSKWRVSVGLHPKKVRDLTEGKRTQLKSLLRQPRVCALGEVGLDYSDPSSDREGQKVALREMLGYCSPEKVLVLHVRGTKEDRVSAEASRDCLEIVKSACDPEQRVHLHCFNGGPQQLREWRAAFPDCHFGITGIAAHPNKDQREALRKIPLDRLLLETDAPYMPMLPGLRTSTPAYIGDVAAAVAAVREEAIEAILVATEANGRRLYRR